MAKTFTKIDFANATIALLNGEMELTAELKANMLEKANALLTTELNRQAYAKEHPSKSKAKGASEKTMALANAIAKVLTAEPKTSNEIATAIGQPDLSPLQIANAIKYVDGVKAGKGKRAVMKANGCRVENLYTVYSK